LAAGVVATLYSWPLPKGNCEAAWHEAHWSFVLTGDLNGGTHGDATLPWRQVASEVVSYLRGRSLPGDHGYMESDIAGEGPGRVADPKMFPVGGPVLGFLFMSIFGNGIVDR
jgi:hypothetical protein